MKKIAIVGCPASGKTTLACNLGSSLDIPVHHLDRLVWGGPAPITDEEFIAQQEEILKNTTWIVEGDFLHSKSYDLRLSKADTIIFFSLPKLIVFQRLLKRFVLYFDKLRPDLGNTSRFHIDRNLVKYIWKYPFLDRKINEYKKDVNKNVIVLRNTQDERQFLDQIKTKQVFLKA